MRNLLFLALSVFMVSCSKNPVPKPDNLLDEEVMTDMLFDIAILQAAEGTMKHRLEENNIDVKTYIYKKYKIDSLTYYQNQKYYAGETRKYKKMHQKVLDRLEEVKAANEIKKDSVLSK